MGPAGLDRLCSARCWSGWGRGKAAAIGRVAIRAGWMMAAQQRGVGVVWYGKEEEEGSRGRWLREKQARKERTGKRWMGIGFWMLLYLVTSQASAAPQRRGVTTVPCACAFLVRIQTPPGGGTVSELAWVCSLLFPFRSTSRLVCSLLFPFRSAGFFNSNNVECIKRRRYDARLLPDSIVSIT